MKTQVAILLCLLVAGCGGNASVWMGGDKEAVFVRVGTVVGNNEFGVLSNWYPNENNDSQLWGVYGIHHVPGEYPIMNPFDTQETLVALCSYVGIQTTMDDNYDNQVSLFTGFEFWDVFFAEVQLDAYDNKASVRDDEVRGVLGIRKVFKF